LIRFAVVVLLTLSLAACSGGRIWPFGKQAPRAPETASTFVFEGNGASVPQYWRRNTVVIDLQGVGGSGAMTARLGDGHRWPMRVAVRVRPGSFGELEVYGAQRVILPVPEDGTAFVDLELPSSIYRRDTAALQISWRAR